jgi:HEPN domain-containing protein
LSARLREYAELLLRKAAHDEYAVERLADDAQAPDEVIGFHAQQAVEKMLKAVLACRGIAYRRTHDLAELVDLLRDSGIDLPAELEDVRELTPFAIEFRYSELPVEDEGPLDRAWALTCVTKTKAWAAAQIRPSRSDR